MRLVLALLALLAAITTPALAFDRKAEDFLLTYGKEYGDWEVICGYFGAEADATCDLRYTDVYSPRPNFKAWLLFFVNGADAAGDPRGPIEAQIRMEWHASLIGGSFTGSDGFEMGLSDCLTGSCTLTGDRLQQLIQAMRTRESITLTFFDYGVDRETRPIPTSQFAAAFDDYTRQRETRSLP